MLKSPVCPGDGASRVWLQLRLHALLSILLGLFSTCAVAAGSAAEPLKFCIAEGLVPPFTAVDHQEPAQLALRQAAHRQGREVQFVARPWRRCFVETAEGRLHGMLPVAPLDANRRLLRFPEREGRLDERLALGAMRVLVLRPRGSTAEWDGQRFYNLRGPILYLAGIKVLDEYFARAQLASDSSAREPEALRLMLLRGRSNVAVDLEARIMRLMRQKDFGAGLEVLPQPLVDFPVYLAISPALQNEQPELVAQLWRDTSRFFQDRLAEQQP